MPKDNVTPLFKPGTEPLNVEVVDISEEMSNLRDHLRSYFRSRARAIEMQVNITGSTIPDKAEARCRIAALFNSADNIATDLLAELEYSIEELFKSAIAGEDK